jgi:hypothetical protein
MRRRPAIAVDAALGGVEWKQVAFLSVAVLSVTHPLRPNIFLDKKQKDAPTSKSTRRSRRREPKMQGGLEPRDPEVERATGGGWRLLFPSRIGLLLAGVVGAVTVFLPDTPIGRVLNEPPVKTTKESAALDDLGIAYKTSETLTPSLGLLLLLGYPVAREYATTDVTRDPSRTSFACGSCAR